MARSLLGSFVGGTRQVLAAQLLISVSAVGLAGWTLAVTNDLIRERERLRERVIQLEQTIAQNGNVVPGPAPTVAPGRAADPVYPGPITDQGDVVSPETGDTGSPPRAEEPTPSSTPGRTVTVDEAGVQPETQPTTPPATTPPQTADDGGAVIGRIITELFTPPPAMSQVVLHARSENDAAYARRVAANLAQTGNVRFVIEVMPQGDTRQSGYAYYDGRQSRAAATLVQQFHDAARRQQIAPWSAQLRGIALPAQGQYSADRLDIVLPPLPATPSTQGVDPRRLRETPPVVRQTSPPPPPPIR